MTNNSENSIVANPFPFLSEDFLKEHPGVVYVGLACIYLLPKLGKGVKYIADRVTFYYCYKVAAENHLLASPGIEEAETLALDESVAA